MLAYYLLRMITKHDDLLGTLIHDVAHLLRHEIDDRLRPHNLTRVKWLALGIIRQNKGLSQAELSDKLELGAASVGRLVDRLVKRGFVERTPDPDDRRSYRLSVTQAAEDLLTELDGVPDHLEREMLDDLSAPELEQLTAGLTKLKATLKDRLTPLALAVVLPAGHLMSSAQTATQYAAAF